MYFIRIDYCSDDWFFIDSRESLVLLVDGKRMGFSGEGSGNHRTSNQSVCETAFYEITKKTN
jgi:hypothetical protein